MSRVPEFLAAYNRIDAYLRKLLKVEKHIHFTTLLKDASKKNGYLAKHLDNLKIINDLRNVIVHEQKKHDYYIAEPHQDIVTIVEEIASTLESPPLVIPKFQRDVITFRSTDYISRPLTFIKENDYSQFPVYDEERGFIGLLTERCIARWVADQVKVEEEMMLIEETTINDVLYFKETGKNVYFLPRTATIFDAQELFTKNRSLDAIIITENKNPNASPLGIISLWDILNFTV